LASLSYGRTRVDQTVSMRALLCTSACCFALVGCLSPAKLDLTDATPMIEQKTPAVGAPLVHVVPSQDVRISREDLGVVGGRPFSGKDLPAWIDRAILKLGTEKFRISTGETQPPDAALMIRPRLIKAYVDSITTSKTAVIVIEAEIVRPDGTALTRHFRGQDAGANWGSGEGEVIESLRRALAVCSAKMRVEIEALLTAGQTARPQVDKP
jgi:hypothetical protein